MFFFVSPRILGVARIFSNFQFSQLVYDTRNKYKMHASKNGKTMTDQSQEQKDAYRLVSLNSDIQSENYQNFDKRITPNKIK